MPNLSSKELTAVEELLNSEFLLIKKFQDLSNTTTDMELKNKYTQIAGQHQGHYNRLLSHLS
jgi:hypothetical protein